MFRSLLCLLIVVSMVGTAAAGQPGEAVPKETLKAMGLGKAQIDAKAEVAAKASDETSTEATDEPTITVAPPEPTELTTDPGYGVKYTKERIIQLPQDQNKFFVTIFGNPNDAKFKTVKSWFRDVPELAYLKAQTHFNTVTTDSPDYRTKYAKGISNLPVVRVQTATGGVVYQASGDSIPLSGQALSRAINSDCLLRWRQRHNQPDEEEQDEAPLDEDEDEVVPDTVVPDTAPPAPEIPLAVILTLAAIAGLGLGGGMTLAKRVKAKRAVGDV